MEQDQEGETIFVDWDAETMQGDGIHDANLICAQSTHAPGTRFEWYGENCVKEFLDLLMALAKKEKVVAVAHNGKGFDFYLIVERLYEDCIKFDQVVVGGPRLIFKDSLCFMQIPLASFAGAFGIQEQAKGFFPHHFNVPENQSYVGELPDIRYYDPDSLSDKEFKGKDGQLTLRRKEFDKWYRTEKESGREFDFLSELKKYCHSDVALLKAGRETFCREFQEVAGFDPFEECITIASACNLFYRKSCMQKNTIALEPSMGWHGRRKPYSDVALHWLKMLPNVQDIRHTCNGGEVVVKCPDGKQIHPDRMDEGRREAYQFYGCYYHGCPTCFTHDRHAPQSHLGGKSLDEKYLETKRQEAVLKRLGHSVIVMWQCQFVEQGPIDPIEVPLEPR